MLAGSEVAANTCDQRAAGLGVAWSVIQRAGEAVERASWCDSSAEADRLLEAAVVEGACAVAEWKG